MSEFLFYLFLFMTVIRVYSCLYDIESLLVVLLGPCEIPGIKIKLTIYKASNVYAESTVRFFCHKALLLI